MATRTPIDLQRGDSTLQGQQIDGQLQGAVQIQDAARPWRS